MNKTRLHRLLLAVLLVTTMMFVLSSVPNVVYATESEWQVSAGTDDSAKYSGANGFRNDQDGMWIGYYNHIDWYVCDGYFRWNNITIPQGYSIQSAYVKIYVENKSGTANIHIYGLDEDNTTTFSADPSGRSLTTDYVEWNGPWTNGEYNTSPDIAWVIQEITDRSEWASGNSLGLKLAGQGSGNNFVGVETNETASGHPAKLEVTYAYSAYCYTFKGPYDEQTGVPLGTTVNVTAIFPEGTSPVTFTVDGEKTYRPLTKPTYFSINLTNDREYWLGMNEDTATIYIFDDSTTVYTIAFLDFAGVLHEFSYVEARRLVNGTLRTVEKRNIDLETKVIMSLINGDIYTISIGDGATYTIGDLRVTDDTTVTLTLKGVDFPKETLLTYKYVRLYGLRVFANPNGNITITYEDTLEETTSVDIYINYKNGTNAYNATETSDSFTHVWANALNNTDYAVVCTVTHERYGEYDWKQYFPRTFSTMPFGLDWLGTLPFNTAYILPALLIVFVAGCFSVINPYLGAFATVVTACFLAYIGWIPIPSATLIVAFTLAILMALIYAKRRITIG